MFCNACGVNVKDGEGLCSNCKAKLIIKSRAEVPSAANRTQETTNKSSSIPPIHQTANQKSSLTSLLEGEQKFTSTKKKVIMSWPFFSLLLISIIGIIVGLMIVVGMWL
jgi:hypothetical protein